MSYYYGDLSSCSSEDVSSSDDEQGTSYFDTNNRASSSSSRSNKGGPPETKPFRQNESGIGEVGICGQTASNSNIWSRTVIHLDIDCFYCQCEEIDRNLRQEKPPRPIAIGQKHIIVTSNYEARKYGVKKLQSRESAMASCPQLWIVEGSDLERYRRHSRAVYEAFRDGLRIITNELIQQQQRLQRGNLEKNKASCESVPKLPAHKGSGMDEMMADITWGVEQLLELESKKHPTKDQEERLYDESIYIYGETRLSSTAVLTEDQTGAETVVSYHDMSQNIQHRSQEDRSMESSRQNVHLQHNMDCNRRECIERLQLASKLVSRLRQHVFEKTKFYTTIGISVSPLLSKLATGLRKPNSINILYPWRSSNFMESMPLRKLHGVGYKTIKALDECLELYAIGPRPEFWTIRDLLRLPRSRISECLESLATFTKTSEQQCDLILENCRGLDKTRIVDDQGGLPKTVSCENSFRRGTMRSMKGVWIALDQLFDRLPRLLKDRTSWSQRPDSAYPTTLRLTARVVDERLRSTKRRPFVTRSVQCRFDGQRLLQTKELSSQCEMIKNAVTPLVRQLLGNSASKDIDVTRLNIAVTNFLDIPELSAAAHSGQSSTTLKNAFQEKRTEKDEKGIKEPNGNVLTKSKPANCDTSHERSASGSEKNGYERKRKSNESSSRSVAVISHQAMPLKEIESRTTASTKTLSLKRPLVTMKTKMNRFSAKVSSTTSNQYSNQIDPTFLAALPPDIAEEVRRTYPQQQRQQNQHSKKSKIDHFFGRKRK